jgi:peptidylprolyl isomerase
MTVALQHDERPPTLTQSLGFYSMPHQRCVQYPQAAVSRRRTPIAEDRRHDERYGRGVSVTLLQPSCRVVPLYAPEEELWMPASSGDTVRVHYRGTLDDGSAFDSSEGRAPLEFTIGEGEVIPGFEAGVDGLDVGGTITVTIEPDQAYGARNEELVHRVDSEVFAEEPYVGAEIELVAPDGSVLPGRIAEISGAECVVDFNHPLAGETLTFDIELVEIVAPDAG